MSEEKPSYGASGTPQTIEAFKNRPCTLLATDSGYEPPEPEEVKALISISGWSQNDVAKLVGVKYDTKRGSTPVRRWCTPREEVEQHRQISYAAWRLLLQYAGVVEQLPADIALSKN